MKSEFQLKLHKSNWGKEYYLKNKQLILQKITNLRARKKYYKDSNREIFEFDYPTTVTNNQL